MITKRVCNHCEKLIDLEKDKYILLGTYTGKDVDDESYYHFKCFVEWYNKKVLEKAKNNTSKIQEKMKELIANPQIAGILGNVGGIDKIKDMLNTNLVGDNKELKDLFNQFDNKKENGRTKKRTRKKTTK